MAACFELNKCQGFVFIVLPICTQNNPETPNSDYRKFALQKETRRNVIFSFVKRKLIFLKNFYEKATFCTPGNFAEGNFIS